jgi:hypothetical protein
MEQQGTPEPKTTAKNPFTEEKQGGSNSRCATTATAEKRDGGNSKYFNHSRYSRYVNSSKNNSNSSVASQNANYDASYCLYP